MDNTDNQNTSHNQFSRWLYGLKLAATTVLLLFISTQMWAQNGVGPSQGKNGGKPTSKPICDITVLSPVLWENGNAGAGDAHLLEGYHLPYRYIMTGLTAGTTYTLKIGFDAKDNSKFALDYVGYYRNYAPHQVFTTGADPDCANHSSALPDGEKVEPWNGTALNGTVFADGTIPEPTYLPLSVRTGTGTWAQASAAQKKFTVFGASSVTVIGYFMDDGTATGLPLQNLTNATAGSVRMGLKVQFVAAGSTAVAAWGGHIASRFDYGNTATGASDISGSPYHTRLVKFANANESVNYEGGSADRSLKAAAVYIPPSCSLTGPTRACPETATLNYTATLDAADFGAVDYAWELLNNTANAALSGTASGNTSLNSLSINVVPASGAGFTPGGSFNLHLRVTRAGLADDCYINSHTAPGDAVTIDDVRVTASATPSNINIFSATHNSVLAAEARLFPAAVDNSLFNFAWTVDAPYTLVGTNVQLAAPPNTVVGALSGANTASPTFTANINSFPGTFTFRVTATEKAAPFCSNSATVAVTVGGALSCPVIAGDNPVCPGSTHSYSYSGGDIPAGSTTLWLVDNGASIVGSATGTSVSVQAGTQNFTVTLRISPANTDLAPLDCSYPVTVDPIPTCTIGGDNAVCAGSTGNTYTSTVLPAGGTVTHLWSVTGNAIIVGSSSDATVSVSANALSADGSFTLTDNITRNGCASSCTKTVTVNATPGCTISGNNNVCEGSTNTYTSTVSPGGGTVTHSWSITGNGSIQGANNGASVDVVAGSAGSYTLTDNISRNSCTSTCSQTYTVVQCVFPHLFPTQTTCCNYDGGNRESFQQQRACITLNANRTKVTNAIPGVFFYYGDFTAASSGAVTIRVDQSRNTSALAAFVPVGTSPGNANVLLDGCQSLPGTVTVTLPGGTNAGDVVFSFTAVAGQNYIVLVKYDMKSIVNKNAPAAPAVETDPWAIYSFSMLVKYGAGSESTVSGSLGQLPLHEKVLVNGQAVSCFDNAGVPSGSCPSPTQFSPSYTVTETVKELQVAAYPNPYHSTVSFKFVSPLSGQASLEVFDMLGRKLAVVYQGSVDAGTTKTIDYKVPAFQHIPMIFRLRVGDKTSYGKLLPMGLF
jgi:hypothetical protein